MEVVAATFRRTSESDRFIPSQGARPSTRPGPFPVHPSALTALSCSFRDLIWTDGSWLS